MNMSNTNNKIKNFANDIIKTEYIIRFNLDDDEYDVGKGYINEKGENIFTPLIAFDNTDNVMNFNPEAKPAEDKIFLKTMHKNLCLKEKFEDRFPDDMFTKDGEYQGQFYYDTEYRYYLKNSDNKNKYLLVLTTPYDENDKEYKECFISSDTEELNKKAKQLNELIRYYNAEYMKLFTDISKNIKNK